MTFYERWWVGDKDPKGVKQTLTFTQNIAVWVEIFAQPKWFLPVISLFKLQPRFYSVCNELEIMCTISFSVLFVLLLADIKQSTKLSRNASAERPRRVIEFARRAKNGNKKFYVPFIIRTFIVQLNGRRERINFVNSEMSTRQWLCLWS